MVIRGRSGEDGVTRKDIKTLHSLIPCPMHLFHLVVLIAGARRLFQKVIKEKKKKKKKKAKPFNCGVLMRKQQRRT